MSFDECRFSGLGKGVHNTQVSAKSDLVGRLIDPPRTRRTGI